MSSISILLAALAVILAWPAPIALERADWPYRSPGAALVLWQAIGLAGGLSMVGAGLAYGLSPLGPSLPRALAALWDNVTHGLGLAGLHAGQFIVLLIAALLAGRLAGTLVWSSVTTLRYRRRHRALLELLSSPSPYLRGARMLEHPAPVAYCLPGSKSTMVLSVGLVELLSTEELDAVVEHERAHLRQRHDILILPFVAWRQALPFLVTTRIAHRSVAALVEMLADDYARMSVRPEVLASAISQTTTTATVGTADLSELAGGSSDAPATSLRVRRLLTGIRPIASWCAGVVIVFSIALLAIPTWLLFAPILG